MEQRAETVSPLRNTPRPIDPQAPGTQSGGSSKRPVGAQLNDQTFKGTTSRGSSVSSSYSGSEGSDSDFPLAASNRGPRARKARKPTVRSTENRAVASRAAPMEYDVALIKFIARDAPLRRFMTTDNAEGVLASLQRFWESEGGSAPPVLRRKLIRFRDRYEALTRILSSDHRNKRTTAWSSDDMARLQEYELRHDNKILDLLHDQVYLDAGNSSGAQATSSPRQSSRPAKPSRKLESGGVDLAGSTAQPSTSLRYDEKQLKSIRDQMNEQSHRIGLLRTQNEEQTRLVEQQAELLKRRAEQAEFEAAQVKLQDEKLDRQMDLLEKIQQQLETLHAASERRD